MKISHEDTIPRQLTSASETSAANDDAISTVQHAPKKRNTIKLVHSKNMKQTLPKNSRITNYKD
ncbi:unnamed protein product [Acanthoscelides obtectus]|uniref:Uncharacterized protein n=1 Tax=Acanthoscelides obtectus TaxID=200917 RepID=A0A9P0JTH9_ACAOB|nr:unnamed protein product [Acanthoscelides obtectus]CAK1642253.1 hypothetical protein AOBTE_LOCUS12923 [Acanthoscelides obtectus]